MAIQRVPGFWDYLGQGVESFNQNRQASNERNRTRKLQELQLLTSLFQSGAVGSDQLKAGANATGIPSFQDLPVIPSQAERRENILKAPPLEIPFPSPISGLPTSKVTLPKAATVTDTEAEAAGMTTPTERRSRVASAKAAELGVKGAELELAAKPKEIQLKQQEETDKHFSDAGVRFVSAEIGDPARLSASNKRATVDAAFAKYKAMRQVSQMGQIPDEAYAKAFFDKAYNDALIEKRKLDIQEQAAINGRISQQDRVFGMVTQRLDGVRKAIDDMRNNNKMLTFYLDKPENEIPDIVKSDLARYRSLLDLEKRLTMAQNAVVDPRIDVDITSQEPPGAPAAQQSKTDTSKFKGRVSRIVQSVEGKPLDEGEKLIQAAVGVDRGITQDEANEAIKELRIRKAKAANPPGRNRQGKPT